jgi:hypothetical protein
MSFPDLFRIPNDFSQEIFRPSPLGSLLSSIVFVGVIGAVIAVLWPRPDRSGRGSRFEQLVMWSDQHVRSFLFYATYVFGTHYREPWVRKLFVLGEFSAIAVAGALLRWPYCLMVISFGLFGVFVIFLHWSRVEDDRVYFITSKKEIPIEGNLKFEVIVACAFIFVFAPIVFAQMQAVDTTSFKVDANAGAFAFPAYMLIEVLKIAPLVQYYDVYADVLNFQSLGAVHDPTYAARFAIIAFRTSADLIILGVVKRILDSAKRVSAGLDLNPYVMRLSNANEAVRVRAAKKLGEFALARKPWAQDHVEAILKTEMYHPYPEVCYEAAVALTRLAPHLSDEDCIDLLKFAIADGYDVIANQGWPEAQDVKTYVQFQEHLGDAYLYWAKREDPKTQMRLTRAQHAYHEAAQRTSDLDDPQLIAHMKNKLAQAQHMLDEWQAAQKR